MRIMTIIIIIVIRSGIRRNIRMWNKYWKKKKDEKKKKVCFTVGIRHSACVIAICYGSKTRSLLQQPQTLTQYTRLLAATALYQCKLVGSFLQNARFLCKNL